MYSLRVILLRGRIYFEFVHVGRELHNCKHARVCTHLSVSRKVLCSFITIVWRNVIFCWCIQTINTDCLKRSL